MKNFFNYSFLFVLVLTFFACTEDDNIPPVLNITDPTEAITVKPGESFLITGSAIDETELDRLIIKSDDLNIETTEMFDDKSGGSFELTIEIDADTSFGSKSITLEAIDALDNISSALVDLTVVP